VKEAAVPECRHWIGAERRHCRSVDSIRDYLPGPRCPLHTPSALAGKGEPGTPPPAPVQPAAPAAVDHRSDLNL
jgi:hypothetical protein